MSWELLLALAALTYGSRAAALVVLPTMPRGVRLVLDRLPAPLFAGLASQALVLPETGLADAQILAAALGALVVAPLRSLPICLVAGLGAYVAASLIL